MKITDIKTDKAYISIITIKDMLDLKEYLQDEFTMRFFDHGVLSDQGIIELLDKKNVIYGIFESKTDKLIGHISYHRWFMVDTYEIGWVLNKNYHNQGIITSLAKKFLKYAFETDKAHRVVATCQPQNPASKRVCEKIGMRLEGHFKSCIFIPRLKEWWDELFYAILSSEYIGG